jgi:transcriptional regulator
LDLLVLSVLGAGPLHGYGIATELRRRSGDELDMAEGTLYPALHRLEREHFVASEWSTGAGRRRRVYKLTARGREALTGHQRDWTRFAAAVQRVVNA